MSFDVDQKAEKRRTLGLIAAPILRRLLPSVVAGRITVRTPDGVMLEHQSGQPGPEAVLHLNSWRALRRLLSGGDLAFAEAYMDGDWSTPDLTALLELAAINLEPLERAITGFWPMRVINRVRHLLKANSRKGSRKNISYHYDLGNDFYRLWLDPGMAYSSALYQTPGDALEQAQDNKLQRIVDLLSPEPGSRILEIGCGWGGLAARLGEAGAFVKGITLSSEQLAHARDLAHNNSLSDRIAFELEDYRDCAGSFDRIVSIEMLEAVGEDYWPTYFGKLRDLLKEQGRAVLQVITIDESRFDFYRANPDFIQRYVFPGGMLPTKKVIAEQAEKAGLRLTSSEFFGLSYAYTLEEWRRRFRQSRSAVEALGFDERFRRMWDYYLAYCEAGFKAGTIDVGFYVLEPASASGQHAAVNPARSMV